MILVNKKIPLLVLFYRLLFLRGCFTMDTVSIIKELAAAQGISLKQLALKLGFGENTIYRWNTKKPTIDKLQKVADYFHVSTDYLLGRDSPTEETDPDVETLQRMAKTYTPEQRKRAIDILKLTIEHERRNSNDD